MNVQDSTQMSKCIDEQDHECIVCEVPWVADKDYITLEREHICASCFESKPSKPVQISQDLFVKVIKNLLDQKELLLLQLDLAY
jgi:hypothetical protein